MRNLDRRLAALETIVEVLLVDSAYEKQPCKNPACILGSGTWQDGESCGVCAGARFTLVRKNRHLIEKNQHTLPGGL